MANVSDPWWDGRSKVIPPEMKKMIDRQQAAAPTAEEALLRELELWLDAAKFKQKKAHEAEQKARLDSIVADKEASDIRRLLSNYGSAKAREQREATVAAEAAAKSATNTAPTPTQETKDPTEAIAAEAKEVWDAAWDQARRYFHSSRQEGSMYHLVRDTRFNDYIKEQGDA